VLPEKDSKKNRALPVNETENSENATKRNGKKTDVSIKTSSTAVVSGKSTAANGLDVGSKSDSRILRAPLANLCRSNVRSKIFQLRVARPPMTRRSEESSTIPIGYSRKVRITSLLMFLSSMKRSRCSHLESRWLQ
jgi:hypothetical protein